MTKRGKKLNQVDKDHASKIHKELGQKKPLGLVLMDNDSILLANDSILLALLVSAFL